MGIIPLWHILVSWILPILVLWIKVPPVIILPWLIKPWPRKSTIIATEAASKVTSVSTEILPAVSISSPLGLGVLVSLTVFELRINIRPMLFKFF